MNKLVNNLKTGLFGEKKAVDYLINKNYNILQKNFRTNIGEIDIIAEKDDVIAFIEVKTRKNENYGYPYESVTSSKQRKIIKSALAYIKLNSITNKQFRFDIIEIFLDGEGRINHIEDAFWA